MSHRTEELIRVVLLFLVALVAFSYFNRDNNLRDHAVESRMALVKALVEEERFEIDSYHSTVFYTRDKAYYDGHYYSDKAIGPSLLGAIVYKAVLWTGAKVGWELKFRFFRDLITILTIAPLSAWIAPLLYLLVRKISPAMPVGQAVFLALAIPLGTPYFKYSTALYGHALAGLFLLGTVFIWFTYRQTDVITWARIFLSGFLLGWMIITEYPTVLLAAAAGMYVLVVLWQKGRLADWRAYALLGCGALIPLSILLFYNYAAFGNPLTLGYGHEATEKFHAAHSSGLFGVGWPSLSALYYMTVQPSMGIFWQSPILLAAIPGWYFMFRNPEFRSEAWLSSMTAGLYIVFMSGYYMWWGYAFTPRHIIPIFPLFIFPLAFVPRKAFPFVVVAGVISIFQMLIVAAGNPDGLANLLLPAFEAHTVSAPASIIYTVYFANLMNGLIVHNLGESLFHLQGFACFIPFVLTELLLIGGLLFLAGRSGRAAERVAPLGVSATRP